MAKRNPMDDRWNKIEALRKALDAFGTDAAEVRVANETVTSWAKTMRMDAAAKFVIGEKVKFYSKRHFGTVRGKIIGFGRKNFKVLATDGVRWRVSPTLLEKDGD